jgi:hypothetical protein
MNSKFRLAISVASFFLFFSGTLFALNITNVSTPYYSAKAQSADNPNAPTPGVRLPGSTTTGTTTGNTTGSTTGSTSSGNSGPTITPPPTPTISNAGLLDGVVGTGNTNNTGGLNTTSTTSPDQAALNSSNTVRTGGIATTGLILLVAAGVGVYYYQKNHKTSKFALKMSEKKISTRNRK